MVACSARKPKRQRGARLVEPGGRGVAARLGGLALLGAATAVSRACRGGPLGGSLRDEPGHGAVRSDRPWRQRGVEGGNNRTS
eukprot:796104-Pyramimonas_sp.AAC.1